MFGVQPLSPDWIWADYHRAMLYQFIANSRNVYQIHCLINKNKEWWMLERTEEWIRRCDWSLSVGTFSPSASYKAFWVSQLNRYFRACMEGSSGVPTNFQWAHQFRFPKYHLPSQDRLGMRTASVIRNPYLTCGKRYWIRKHRICAI